MSINKNDQVKVGISSPDVDPASGLPMYRRFKSFEANRELEVIKVWYEEWLEYPTLMRSESKTKHYVVKNLEEESHIVPEVGHIVAAIGHDDEFGNYIIDVEEQYIIDSPEHTVITQVANYGFSNWYNYVIVSQMVGLTIGGGLIVSSINAALKNIPFDAPDGYTTTK